MRSLPGLAHVFVIEKLYTRKFSCSFITASVPACMSFRSRPPRPTLGWDPLTVRLPSAAYGMGKHARTHDGRCVAGARQEQGHSTRDSGDIGDGLGGRAVRRWRGGHGRPGVTERGAGADDVGAGRPAVAARA